MSKQQVKPYSAEFKKRAVKLALETDQTVAQNRAYMALKMKMSQTC
jgi:hypothetical protein